MPKLKSMNAPQLRQLLIENNLLDTGNKAELVARLTAALGSDEAQLPQNSTDVLQRQINDLRKTLSEAMTIMQTTIQATMSSSRAHQPTNPTEAVTDNFDTSSVLDETVVPRHPNATPTQGYQYSVREISQLIPEFNPTDDSSLSVEQFIEAVERAKEAYSWSDKHLLLAIYERFKGVARNWLDSSAGFYNNWNDFAVAIETEFGNTLNEAEISLKMRNAMRKADEKVSEYCFRMSALGKRFGLSDAAVIRYTRDGLRHRDLQTALAATRFSSMKELRLTCEMYFSNVKHPDKVDKPLNMGGKPATLANTKHETKPDMRRLTCYNCNEMGHISSQCHKPPRRKRCKDCQKVHPKGEAENCGKPASVKRVEVVEVLNTFEKTVLIKGKKYIAYIDTGSECHMIRRSSFETLGIAAIPCHVKMSGLWGGNYLVKESVAIEMAIDEVELQLTMYVVDNDVLPTDLLLGSELFLKDNVEARIANGDLKILLKHQPTKQCNKTMINEKPPITPNELQTGDISDNDLKALLEIINKHRSVFADGLSDLGKTDLVEMEISLSVAQPFLQKPYRVPEPKKQIVADMINELLENDIVEKSMSNYASPMLLVKKKNGKDRLCVDYRLLNKHTAKEIFPMPNIKESLQQAKRHTFFISLDMNSGFYQIPIAKSSRKFTAFITPDGLYEFKRMPFGLKNAPAVFQRLMAMLRDKLPNDLIYYMDDILIGGQTIAETLGKLERVLKVLQSANLTLNFCKCVFLTNKIEFLGHQLTANGIEPGKVKTEAIRNFPQPGNVTEVRRFLGLSGYFRKFVPGFAQVSEPLRQLLRKDSTFTWTESQTTAFEKLKVSLTTHPVLAGFNVAAEHELHTDASAAGLSGVLLQAEKGDWKPVAYYSRSTTESESRFHSYELEALAVVEALERFRYYIYGKTIKVVTDCNAITTLMTKREILPRIARWWLKIQDFDIQLQHRIGQRMPHVDALSRAAVEKPREPDVVDMRVAKIQISNDDWLFSMQLQDKGLRETVAKLQNNEPETSNQFSLADGRLFKKTNNKLLWVVPKCMRWKIVHDSHDKAGHLGLEKTLKRLQENFWFARMRNFVKAYVKSCIECAYNKLKGGQKEAEYHYSEIEPVPFKILHIDHLGPFPRSRKRNEHVLVIVDAFTKFVRIKAVRNTSTKYVVDTLDELSSYTGMPECIVSDRGTAFTSHEFRRYCEKNEIKHQLNAVRTPRANGQVERINRTLLSMLTTMTSEDKLWDEKLREIQWSLNTMESCSTGRTPLQLLYTFTPRDILQNKIILALHSDEILTEEQLRGQREEAARLINRKRAEAKQRFDKAHRKPQNYSIGDLVLVESEPASLGHSRKLEPRYKGPFTITKTLGNDRYVIEDLPRTRRTKRHYSSVYSADKMKRWCQLHDDDFSGQSDDSSDEFEPEDEDARCDRMAEL